MAEGLQGFRVLTARRLALHSLDDLGRGLLDGDGAGGGLGLGLLLGLGLGIEGANVELGMPLLEDALVVVFPELLGRILAGDSLQDLLAAYRHETLVYIYCSLKMQMDFCLPMCAKANGRFGDNNIPGWSSWNLVTS